MLHLCRTLCHKPSLCTLSTLNMCRSLLLLRVCKIVHENMQKIRGRCITQLAKLSVDQSAGRTNTWRNKKTKSALCRVPYGGSYAEIQYQVTFFFLLFLQHIFIQKSEVQVPQVTILNACDSTLEFWKYCQCGQHSPVLRVPEVLQWSLH